MQNYTELKQLSDIKRPCARHYVPMLLNKNGKMKAAFWRHVEKALLKTVLAAEWTWFPPRSSDLFIYFISI